MHQHSVSRYRVNSWSLLTALSLTLGMASFSMIEPAWAQEQRLRTLTVTGQSLVNIPTSLTQVRLGVEVKGDTAESVQQEVARRSDAVVSLLRLRSVEKLETTGVSLSPTYSYEGNVQRPTGFIGTNTVSFRIDTRRAGNILDDAVKAGATRIDGISFIAADSAIEAARQQALRAATLDAQKQADAVLSSLNLTRRDIVSIQVNGAFAPPPEPLQFSARDASAPKTPIIGGEQQINASVTLQISY